MTINGRTPEEIKRDIDRCSDCNGCAGCWNIGNTDCVETNMANALALIERLESERDAALAKVPKWIGVGGAVAGGKGKRSCALC